MSSSQEPPADSAASSRPPGIAVRELLGAVDLDLELEVATGESALDRVVRETRIQKSGLAMVGHFHGIDPSRIQLLGMTEMSYLSQLSAEQRAGALHRYLDLDLCCVIVTRAAEVEQSRRPALDELLRQAQDVDTPVLLCSGRSNRTIVGLHGWLDERLAPRARVHGVLLDVFEVGLLLLGTSGIGKSEVALELVMRGHRLVADDVVECHYRPPGMVFGEPANLLRHHLEVRGLGILNVKDLFGVTAVRDCKRIDVVVQLTEDTGASEVDRLGLEQRVHHLLGVDIPALLIPVRIGRDMASIMEIAARNELLKRAGHQPELEFFGKLDESLLGAPPGGRAPRGDAPAPAPPSVPAAAPQPPESSYGVPPWRRRR